MKQKLIYIFFFLSTGLFAQDPSFSQFYNNPSYFNPSTSSYYPGMSAILAYRNLWTKLPGNFGTEYASITYNLCHGNGFKGLGISVTDDREGLSWLQTRSIGINPVFGVQIGKFAFNTSISPQITQKTINLNNLIFSDQLDEVKGPNGTTAFVMPQSGRSKLMIDPNWSISGKYQGSNSNIYDRHVIIMAGYAMHHVREPNQSFTGYTSKLPRKDIIHITSYIPINWFNITPGFIWEKQAKYQTIMCGSNFDVQGLAVGMWYRRYLNSDAVVFYASFLLDPNENDNSKFQVSYSYDMTVSNQKFSSGGSHEIILSYLFLRRCGKSSKLKAYQCPPAFQKYKTKLHFNFKGWY